MLPERRSTAMTAQLAVVGNPSSLHRTGRERAPGGRGVPRADRAGARRPARPRSSSPRAAPSPTTSRSRAPTGPAGTPTPPRVRLLVGAIEHHAVLDCVDFLVAHEGAEVDLAGVDRDGRRRARAAAPRHRTATRSRSRSVGDVGQQRGRHGAGRRARSPRSRTSTASPCTPTPYRPPATCPSTSPPAAPTCMSVTAAQAGRPGRRRAPSSPGGTSPLVAAQPRRRAGAPGPSAAPWTRPRSSASPRRSSRAVASLEQEAARVAALRDDLVARALRLAPDIRPSSGRGEVGDPSGACRATPTCSCPAATATPCSTCSTPQGVECSTGSACQAGVPQPSHVLLAMGVPETRRPWGAAAHARPHLDPGRRRRRHRGPARRHRPGPPRARRHRRREGCASSRR